MDLHKLYRVLRHVLDTANGGFENSLATKSETLFSCSWVELIGELNKSLAAERHGMVPIRNAFLEQERLVREEQMKSQPKAATCESGTNLVVEMIIPGVFTVILLGCLIHLGVSFAQTQTQQPEMAREAISAFAN